MHIMAYYNLVLGKTRLSEIGYCLLPRCSYKSPPVRHNKTLYEANSDNATSSELSSPSNTCVLNMILQRPKDPYRRTEPNYFRCFDLKRQMEAVLKMMFPLSARKAQNLRNKAFPMFFCSFHEYTNSHHGAYVTNSPHLQ